MDFSSLSVSSQYYQLIKVEYSKLNFFVSSSRKESEIQRNVLADVENVHYPIECWPLRSIRLFFPSEGTLWNIQLSWFKYCDIEETFSFPLMQLLLSVYFIYNRLVDEFFLASFKVLCKSIHPPSDIFHFIVTISLGFSVTDQLKVVHNYELKEKSDIFF